MALKANLGNLNPELLATILQYVVGSSIRLFPTLNLVNRYFNNVTKTLIRRNIFLDFDHDAISATNEKIEKLLSEDLILPNIRHLKIMGSPGYIISTPSPDQLRHREAKGQTENHGVRKRVRRKQYDRYGLLFRPLEELITKTYKLQTFHWSVNEPIPKAILQAIMTRHPTASLSISRWRREGDDIDHTNEDELALITCPNLHSIQASFPVRSWTRGVKYDYREVAFWRVVTTAPNLKHAAISKLPAPRHVPHYLRVKDSKARLFEGPVQRMLESLTLDGYDHGVLDHIEKYVDPSQLRSLKYTRGFPGPDVLFFETAKLKLTNLKHLSLNFTTVPRPIADDLVSAATDFMSHSYQLESVSFWSWNEIIDMFSFRDTVGPNLKSLQLHERDAPNRHFIDPLYLGRVLDAYPNLSDITIDINLANGLDTFNTQICEELALTQPNLRKVQIYTTASNPLSLNKTLQLFHQIYMQIFSVSAHDPTTLLPSTTLDVKFGEWESKGGYLGIKQDPKYYRIRPAERDEDNRRGNIRVELERYVGTQIGTGTKREVVCESYPTLTNLDEVELED